MVRVTLSGNSSEVTPDAYSAQIADASLVSIVVIIALLHPCSDPTPIGL